MKTTLKITIILLLVTTISYSQVHIHVHTHINNTDKETRRKLETLILFRLGVEIAAMKATNNDLKEAKNNHKIQLDKQYSANQFDRGDSFISNAIGSSALSFGPSFLANMVDLPYMTKEKKDYLNALAMDKAVLSSLLIVSKSKIKSAKRQEIYRLRSKLLREYSKIDRDSRSLLNLPVAGLIVSNYESLLEALELFNGVEITL